VTVHREWSARCIFLILFACLPPAQARSEAEDPPRNLAQPVEDGPFLRPAKSQAAEPTWGIKGGIAVGLWPNPGPRGLIRVYTPYLGQARLTPINFVAVEPIIGGTRGLSELEPSRVDKGAAGKAMWPADNLDEVTLRRAPWRPVQGMIGGKQGRRVLSVFIGVEPFDNGARPIVEIRLREDRPHEVSFRVFAAPGGKPMRSCILTATMGNYARLRRLYLREHVAESHQVYDPFRPVFAGFAPHRQWGIDELLVRDGRAIVAATPDEPDPAHAHYNPDVALHWHYQGAVAIQYWHAPARPGLVARVNGRQTYWASRAPIPGGVAYENFELEAPFEPGQEFSFGVTRDSPVKQGFARP
jgi:hypothetical protein